MGTYLFQFSYSPESLRAMIDNPQDRKAAVSTSAESLGGSLTGMWYAFGEYDGYGVAEFPDDAAAAAFAVTVGSTGALSKFVTVPLMETEVGVEAFRTAQNASYAAPA